MRPYHYKGASHWQLTLSSYMATIPIYVLGSAPKLALPSSTPDVADLVHAAKDRLLGAVVANNHLVLCTLFPPTIVRRPGLWPIPHDFTLLLKNNNNFISQVLHRSLQPQSTNNI